MSSDPPTPAPLLSSYYRYWTDESYNAVDVVVDLAARISPAASESPSLDDVLSSRRVHAYSRSEACRRPYNAGARVSNTRALCGRVPSATSLPLSCLPLSCLFSSCLRSSCLPLRRRCTPMHHQQQQQTATAATKQAKAIATTVSLCTSFDTGGADASSPRNHDGGGATGKGEGGRGDGQGGKGGGKGGGNGGGDGGGGDDVGVSGGSGGEVGGAFGRGELGGGGGGGGVRGGCGVGV